MLRHGETLHECQTLVSISKTAGANQGVLRASLPITKPPRFSSKHEMKHGRLWSAFLLVCWCACAQESRLQVQVDPRIELMAVVEILAGYGWTGLLSKEDTAYRRDVDAWFLAHKDHPAVKRFAELSKAGYTFDGPAQTMVCLSTLPDLKLQAAPSDCSAGRAGGERSLAAWLDQLRDFAAKSEFPAFFRAHRGLYSMMEETTRKKIEKDYAANLEDYFGTKQTSYHIALAPLLVGNFGPRVPRGAGTFDIYGILGAAGQSNGVPQFGSLESLRSLVWHEFGHSFVNPEVDLLRDSVDKSKKLLGPIEQKMRPQAYQDWLTVVREHVVRAMTTRLAFRELGDDAGRAALWREKSRGFAYVEMLAERLKEYEANRDRYPTFRTFAPRLLAVFDELAARDLPPDFYAIPYTGAIDSVYAGGRPVLVVPTGESDAAAQTRIRDYVQTIRDRLLKDSEILTDVEALSRDLSRSPVIAYGTLAGNKWLERYREGIPALAEFQTPEIQAMSGGDPLRLIASFPHPQNPKLGALVYTATDAASVAGINSLMHGSTAYVIGRGTMVLKTGDYAERAGRWVLRN